MTIMHHVIPHPGFLRDAGSPEQAIHVMGDIFGWAELLQENPTQRVLLPFKRKKVPRQGAALFVTSQDKAVFVALPECCCHFLLACDCQ